MKHKQQQTLFLLIFFVYEKSCSTVFSLKSFACLKIADIFLISGAALECLFIAVGRSGVGSRAFAEHIPGTGGSSLEGLRGSSSGLGADMQRLRMQTQERGEKLSELQDASQRMQDSAMKFSSDAHAVSLVVAFVELAWSSYAVRLIRSCFLIQSIIFLQLAQKFKNKKWYQL